MPATSRTAYDSSVRSVAAWDVWMWLIIWPKPAIIVLTPPSGALAAASRRCFIWGTIVSSMATKPLTPLVM